MGVNTQGVGKSSQLIGSEHLAGHPHLHDADGLFFRAGVQAQQVLVQVLLAFFVESADHDRGDHALLAQGTHHRIAQDGQVTIVVRPDPAVGVEQPGVLGGLQAGQLLLQQGDHEPLVLVEGLHGLAHAGRHIRHPGGSEAAQDPRSLRGQGRHALGLQTGISRPLGHLPSAACPLSLHLSLAVQGCITFPFALRANISLGLAGEVVPVILLDVAFPLPLGELLDAGISYPRLLAVELHRRRPGTVLHGLVALGEIPVTLDTTVHRGFPINGPGHVLAALFIAHQVSLGLAGDVLGAVKREIDLVGTHPAAVT